MNRLTEKLAAVEAEIAAERGRLNLFAVLERDDLAERWDLVVSAPWARQDKATLGYIADAVKRHLLPDEMVSLARIVVLPAGEEPVRSINDIYEVEHGRVELHEPARFGLPVKHGYIITSSRAA